ncbi:hypothetical protein J437_LFUL016643 [Ladona fulva]|uniref:Uncharacterized protein n=1 Tax=Ladona fulva TaxID=123851 RepID=A0A8K0KKZ3_LADFU|nr:hypothetical protein J437_LFUL016643 [Ladona fulva]
MVDLSRSAIEAELHAKDCSDSESSLDDKLCNCSSVKNTNKQKQTEKFDKEWSDTMSEEIIAYVGILIYMGVYEL